MLGGLIQPAFPVGDRAGEEVPLRILRRGAPQQLLGPADVPHIDGLSDLRIKAAGGAAGILLLIVSAISVLPPISALALVTAGIPTAAAHPGDGIVGLVDLLHLLFRQISQGIVLVIVGMILARQLTVGPLDLIVAGVRLDAQYAIRIAHVLCLLFL